MYHFYVQAEVVGRTMPVPATITVPLRSTNKAHGKLTGINFLFHQWCDYRQYQQG